MEPTNFISDFLHYNSGNECPKPYVMWTAYGLLSVASGHRVWMDLGIDNFFLRTDLYILLVGTSGGRKTASMLLGRDLLRDAIPDVVFSADNETYQGVISVLTNEKNLRKYYNEKGIEVDYRPYHIFVEELMDYIQLNPVAMVTFLTNIYGKKGYHYRLKNEENFVPNTFVTLMGCSVPEWLTDQIQSKQFSEGYGRRTIIVCHEGIIRRKPVLLPAHLDSKQRCIARLQRVHQLVGQAKLTPEAEDFFWKWYETQKDPDDKFLKNWYSTRHLNVLKIAMLSSLAERDDLVVELRYVKLALGLVEEIEKQLPMVTSRLGRSEVLGPSLEVLRIINNHDGRMLDVDIRKETYKLFKDGMEQFRTFQHLSSTGQIKIEELQVNGVKKRYVTIPK